MNVALIKIGGTSSDFNVVLNGTSYDVIADSLVCLINGISFATGGRGQRQVTATYTFVDVPKNQEMFKAFDGNAGETVDERNKRTNEAVETIYSFFESIGFDSPTVFFENEKSFDVRGDVYTVRASFVLSNQCDWLSGLVPADAFGVYVDQDGRAYITPDGKYYYGYGLSPDTGEILYTDEVGKSYIDVTGSYYAWGGEKR